MTDSEKASNAFQAVIDALEEGGLPEINKDTLKTQALRDNLLEKVPASGG